MGNVVVNAVMRTLTREAVGKVIRTARSSSGKEEGARWVRRESRIERGVCDG
jgi:hypothetical protein